MKNIFRACILTLFVVLAIPLEGQAATDWIEHSLKTNVPIDKTWEITMNHAIDKTTINNDSIFVLDAKGNKVKTSLVYTADKGIIKVEAPKNYYDTETIYTLYVTDAVKDKNGKALKATKMKFKTNNNLVVEDIFVENERNIVELKDNVTVIDEIGDAISKYDNNSVTIVRPTEQMKKVNEGEIMILPPTKDFPFGYAVRIVQKAETGDTLQLKVKEPTEEELIESLDIASTIPLSAIDNLDELNEQNNTVASLGPVVKTDTRTFNFNATENGFSITFDNLTLEDKLRLSGKATFNGDVNVLEQDDYKAITTDLTFKTNLTLNMFYVHDKKGKKPSAEDIYRKMILLTKKPITFRLPQTAYFVGLSLKPSLVYEVKGYVGSELGLDSTIQTRIGFNTSENAIPVVDYVNADSVFSLGALDAHGSAKLGFELPFALVFAQFELLTVGAEAGVEATLEGYIDGIFEFNDIENLIPTTSTGTNYCVKASLDLYANPYAALGEIDNPSDKFVFFKQTKNIKTIQNCSIKSLNTKAQTVPAYTALNFPVTALDYQGSTQSFNLYDKQIKLENIDSDKIVKVPKTVPLTNIEIPGKSFNYRFENVKIGDKVKARLSYTNLFTKAVTKQDVTFTIAGNVQGTIVDEKGKAIKGATVQLLNNNKKLIETVTTGSDGKYEFISTNNDYSLKVTHPNYEKEQVNGSLNSLIKDKKITLSKLEKISYTIEKLDKRYTYIKLKSSSINLNALNKQLMQPAKDAKEFYDDMKGNVVFSTADSKVMYSDSNYLSINIQTGNDYIAPDSLGFLIDLRTGKRLTVNDVFKTTAQRNQLVQKIKSELRRLGEPQKNSLYREDWLDYDSSWGIYATKKGYMIILGYYNGANIFDLYEILVPYSESISLDEIQ